jgi:tetratricopeptide (TPR) repeat protein
MHAPRTFVFWVACVGLALSLVSGSRSAVASPIPGGAVPVDSLYSLAGELYSTQRYVEAIPLFEQVLSLNPRFANAYALLGSSFLHLGVYEDAIANFESALQLDEGIKLAYLGLIAANYYTSNIEAAQKWARKCLPVLSPAEKDRWLELFERKFPQLGIGFATARRTDGAG